MPRTGNDYLQSLQDERCVYLDGGRLCDVSNHPALRNAVRSIAALYDFQSHPENTARMTFETSTGRRVNRSWQLPTSYEDLVARREALVSWAELHQGFMGRSPDHVASTLSAMMMGLDIYESYPGGRASRVHEYYKYARDNDLYVSYVIMDPQGDRSKGTSEGGNADLAAAICDEDAAGITVHGAKMLGTGATLSNEVLVTSVRPLKPADDRYAFTAVVPIAAKGVKLLSRRSYEAAASTAFDYPLSTHFDENDALIYFDEVKIPWERVFVYRDTKCQYAQWTDTQAHAYQNYQSEIRLLVKLRFLVGLARKITETIGTINYPSVRETLGELASCVGTIEAFVLAMEAKGYHQGPYYLPDPQLLYAAQVQSQLIYPKVIHTLRELSGAGVLMLPSNSADLENPEIADIVHKTQYSPAMSSTERVQLFKLAWDAVGSEFASRHLQYEMFYSGSRLITAERSYRHFDWQRATGAVDQVVASCSRPGEIFAPAGRPNSAAGK
jgi:4-hydroxyphenylacetate 3-monooxygenase